MPALTAETTDYRLSLDAGQRCHWIVGRDPACELYLRDAGISRFHATIFHVDGAFSVIDHSRNGSHLFRDEEEFRVALETPLPPPGTAPPDVVAFETTEIPPVEYLTPTVAADGGEIDVHRSYGELKLQQRISVVPALPGFRRAAIVSPEGMKPLLDMIYGGDAETLAGMARPLRPGNVLLFPGFDRHCFRFEE